MQDEILTLCSAAYRSADDGQLGLALRQFYQAWVLIPKPQYDYEEAGWVLTAIGDTYYRKADYEPAIEALESALHCRNTASNPVVLKRLGQCHFELGNREQAVVYLQQALRHGGSKIFDHEPARHWQLVCRP